MPSDPIGEIPIVISGDTSQLEKDLRTAEEMAKAAGQKISDALAAGSLGSDQLDESLKTLTASGLSVNQAMIQVAAGLKDVGQVASETAAKLNDIGSAGVKPLEDIRDALQRMRDEAKQAADAAKTLEDAAAQAKFEEFANNVEQWIRSPLRMAGAAAKEFLLEIGPLGAGAIAAGAGLAVLGKEIVDLVLAEGKATESTQNFADRLQLSFQDTQKLSEMADIAGISVTVLERASARLATAFEDSDGAGKKVAAALDNMGIVADGTGQTLVKLLEHLASLPTASERMAEATAVMGRGAIQLEPLLKNYASLQEAVESLGGHITDEMVSKLLAADDASDKLGITWGHLKQNLAATFAPAVTIGLEALVKLLSGTPEPRLQTQIDDLISEINRLKLSADQASIAVTSMMGGGFTSIPATTGLIAQKEALLSYLQAQKDAIARSKEYNAAIDASNRASEIWAQGAKERAKEVKAAFSSLGLLDLAIEVGKVTAAFDLLKGKLSDNSVIASTEKLFDLLNTAFKEGAISEEQFTSETERLGQIMDAAIMRVDAIKNSVKQFGDSFDNDSFRIGDELMKDLGTAALETRTDFVSFEMAAAELGTAIEALGSSKGLPSVKLALAELHQSLKDLGTDRAAIAQFNATLGGATTLDTAEIAWSRVSGVIDRIGKNDLPLAIEQYRKFIGFLEQHNAAVGTIYNSEAKLLQLEINEKTLRGESATAEIIALEQIRLKTESLTFSSQALGKVYVGLIRDFQNAFDQLGKSIADNIVDGKKWHDVWQTLIKNVAKSILETLIGTAFKALGEEIIRQTHLAEGLAAVLKAIGLIKLVGGSGEVLKEGARLPGGVIQGTGEGSGEGGSGSASGSNLPDTSQAERELTKAISDLTPAVTAAKVATVAASAASVASNAAIQSSVSGLIFSNKELIDSGNVVVATMEKVDSGLIDEARAAQLVAEASGVNSVATTANTVAIALDTGAETAGTAVETAQLPVMTSQLGATTADTTAELANTIALEADTASRGAAAAAESASGIGGVLSSIRGTISDLASGGLLGAGIAAAAGITQGIQMSRLINLTGEIEISTRQIKEQITGGTQFALNTYLPELKHLVDIWGEIQRTNDILLSGAVGGSGGGGNTVTIVENGPASGTGNGPTATPSQNITLANPPDVSGTVVSVPAATTPFTSAIGQISQGAQSGITSGENYVSYNGMLMPKSQAAAAEAARQASIQAAYAAAPRAGVSEGSSTSEASNLLQQVLSHPEQFTSATYQGMPISIASLIQLLEEKLFQQVRLQSSWNASPPISATNPDWLMPESGIGGNSYGQSNAVTVYALDPTAQGVANAITKSLHNNGIKTR